MKYRRGDVIKKVLICLMLVGVVNSFTYDTTVVNNNWSGAVCSSPTFASRCYYSGIGYSIQPPAGYYFVASDPNTTGPECPYPGENYITSPLECHYNKCAIKTDSILADSVAKCLARRGTPNYTAVSRTEETWDIYGTGCQKITGSCDNIDSIRSCLDPHNTRSPICKGGFGQMYIGGGTAVASAVAADGYSDDATVKYNYITVGDYYTYTDGSKCSMYNTGTGPVIKMLVCSEGWSSVACDIDPTLSHCKKSSASTSVSSSSSQTTKEKVCEQYPDLPTCQSSPSQGSSSASGVGGSSGSGAGIGCAELQNCDWADIDNQVAQLDVSIKTREDIQRIIDLQKNGYEISVEQSNLLREIGNSIEGLSDVMKDGFDSLEASESGEESTGIDTAGLGQAGNGVGQGLSGDTIQDGIEFASDEDLMTKAKNLADGQTQNRQDSIDTYITAMQGEITESVSPLTDYLSRYDGKTKIAITFDTGVMGISCKNCEIDLANVYGFNTITFFDMLFRMVAAVTAVVMVANTIKTGGHQ